MDITIDKIIVWLIVGAFAGAFVGKLPTRRERTWLARTGNLGIGLAGALIGGVLFTVFGIKLPLDQIEFTLEDLLAAIFGSLILLFSVHLYRWYKDRKSTHKPSKSGATYDSPSGD